MYITLAIFLTTIILMILSIAFFPHINIKRRKIDTYWIIALLGMIMLFIFNKINISDYINKLTESNSVNPIKIIVLFFSMTLLSIYLDELGFFRYIASIAVKYSKNNQFSIFTIFYFTISILTVFTSNDIVILTFTPFILYFTKHSKIDPMPYLVSEFIAANTLSLTLLIGNPTNIYISLIENISFIDYFKMMGLRSIILCIFTYILLLLIYNRKLKTKVIKEEVDIKIDDKISVIVSLITLLISTILMAISSYINLEMYFVALIFAVITLLFHIIYSSIKNKNINTTKNVIKRLPYNLIPFLFSMFAIVMSLDINGITEKLSSILNTKNNILSIGYSSFLACSLMNNIPMSVLFSSILNMGSFELKAIYAAIIGSNIGALFTPVGALAGIMFLNIVNTTDVKMNYVDFVKRLMPISIIIMTVALILLMI